MRTLSIISVLTFTTALSAGAVAADNEDSNAATSEAGIAEVVVTANKLTAQSVLDVPSSLQAISGDALRANGVSGFMDLAGDIPGLAVEDQGPGDRHPLLLAAG